VKEDHGEGGGELDKEDRVDFLDEVAAGRDRKRNSVLFVHT